MKKLLYLFLCLCIGFQMKAQTVVDIVVASPNHNTLEAAVIAAELADDLSGPGPFTVFAPTDAAFAALPAGTVDALLADPTGDLANILLYHVLGLQALSTDLTNGMMVTTLQGEEIVVTIDMNGVFINNAQVTVADIQASNGVVHVIDAVLLPPVMPTNSIMDIVAGSDVHNTLEAALVASGLNETLANPGDFTLFAPTDAAFAALPAGAVDALLADPFGGLVDVLLYHALGGTALSTDLADGLMVTTLQGQDVTVTINANGVFINDAQVIIADIMADNGVVHVIDAVL
ncbi:MAG: fasciclin domain-containing protein, partial [Flavobacteriales bacterium]